jgi:hypothetical protein
MKIGNRLPVLAAAVLLVGTLVSPRAQSQSDAAAIPIGAKDIGGVVSSPQGREAGVWVIAETTELPTQFRRISASRYPLGGYAWMDAAPCFADRCCF